jgi:hypothetical protein
MQEFKIEIDASQITIFILTSYSVLGNAGRKVACEVAVEPIRPAQ